MRRRSVKPRALTPIHHGGKVRRRRARGIVRLRQAVRQLEEAGYSWWPSEAGWPSEPLDSRSTRAIITTLLHTIDKEWHAGGWDWFGPDARLLDCFYDVITRLPIPRRVLEQLSATGLLYLARLHGIARVDDR